ncbi:nuclear protein localization protein 4, partial [Serendipita sp. 411]
MIVRIRSKDGTFRIELPPTADAAELATKILEITKNADPSSLMLSDKPRGGEQPMSKLLGFTLETMNI